LPLQPGQHVLVTGSGADNIGKQSGGWTITWQGTGNVNADFPGATSIYGGLEDALTAIGGSAELSVDGAYTSRPDVAVVVFGEEPYAEFQGDRETLEFEPVSKTSLALLQKLKAENIPVVGVFLSGRPMWVNPEINASDAFVAAWLPGSEGAGVADVFVSDSEGQPRFDFTGTLSFSWPKTPLQDVLNPHHAGYDPLFPLGYGLSYSNLVADLAPLAEDVDGVASADADMIAIFAGRPQAPWQLWLGDGQTTVLLSGAHAALPSGAATLTTTDMAVQEDALKAVWAGGQEASVTIQADGADTSYDFSAMLAAGGALRFDVLVDQAPQGPLNLQLGCGEGCTRAVDIAARLGPLEGGGWQPIEVALTCFARDGDSFAKITQPFGFVTAHPAAVSVANIQVLKTKATKQDCR